MWLVCSNNNLFIVQDIIMHSTLTGGVYKILSKEHTIVTHCSYKIIYQRPQEL